MRRLLVIGCGHVGEAVAERARRAGWRVVAWVRRPERAAELQAVGFEALAGDIARGGDWEETLRPEADAVVVSISAGGGGAAGYRETYVAGLARLRQWAAGGHIGRLIYTSSTGVYPAGGGVHVDETSPVWAPGADTTGSALVEAEAEVRAGEAGGAWGRGVSLRLAGIYGPGRHHLLDALRRGVVEFAGRGDTHLNIIHREDAAAAVWAVATAAAVPASVYNVADGQPATKAEMLAWLAKRLGRPVPVFRPDLASARDSARGGPVPDRIIVAERLRQDLGWQPRYPDYRAGYAELL